MHRLGIGSVSIVAALALAGGLAAAETADSAPAAPTIRSMSALAFGPDGVLFIGDGKGGAVFAVDLGEQAPGEVSEGLQVGNIEAKVAALLGTTADEVMIHDLAVHPVSRQVYLAVSRGRAAWDSGWKLPNDVADATILLRVDLAGEIREVPLAGARITRAELPNPVDPAKMHPWKKDVSLRADTITDMAFDEGVLWVAGLSNEEFASALWKVPYPFGGAASATTIEIFHGAHGEFETHAPIRTFVPYRLKGESHLLAAYLCTPFVTFRTADLQDGKHVKGRTVGEFGSGNYPLDMVVFRKDGKERLLIANSNLPLMIVDPADIESYEGEIIEEPKTYLAGIPYEPRSGTGIQQLDLLGSEYLVALKRQLNGSLDLVSVRVARF